MHKDYQKATSVIILTSMAFHQTKINETKQQRRITLCNHSKCVKKICTKEARLKSKSGNSP